MADDLSLVTPGSVTDLARALRELIKALGDIGKFVGRAADLYDRRKARRAARSLAKLAFPKSGMRGPLERIAAGAGLPEDIEEIARRLAQTAGEIEESIRLIDWYNNRPREQLGMAAALKVEDIIHGPVNKEMIKMSLSDLVTALDPERAKQIAVTGLFWIEEVNKQLIELHDLVLLPKRATRKSAKIRKVQ